MSVRDPAFQLVKLFLPKRYSSVFSDEDVGSINSAKVKLYLI